MLHITKSDIRDDSFFLSGTYKGTSFKYSFSQNIGARIKLFNFEGPEIDGRHLILEIKEGCVKELGLQRFYMHFHKVDINSDRFIIEGIYDHIGFEYIGSERGKWLKLKDFDGTAEESVALMTAIEEYCFANLDLTDFQDSDLKEGT